MGSVPRRSMLIARRDGTAPEEVARLKPLRMVQRFSFILVLLLVGSLVLAACGDDGDDSEASTSTPTEKVSSTEAATKAETESNSGDAADLGSLDGRVTVDGSSTVFPVTQAMAEEFQLQAPGVEVPVGVSGTGGGFEKFCSNETDISDASRPIKPEEAEACAANDVEYVEIPVAWDGIAVVVNPANEWVECLTVEELTKMWAPEAEGEVTSWQDIRADFPDEPLDLYGPGTDSGTYDYFTDAIVGEEGASRGDFTASEDDNVLVQGVAGSKGAIGFFGYAYYEENQNILKLVGVDAGDGCIEPSETTINDGTYQPLSRPIFIYVSTTAAERPEVQAFVNFYLENAAEIIPQIGYVPFGDSLYAALTERFTAGKTGSVFGVGGSTEGVTIEDLIFEDEQIS